MLVLSLNVCGRQGYSHRSRGGEAAVAWVPCGSTRGRAKPSSLLYLRVRTNLNPLASLALPQQNRGDRAHVFCLTLVDPVIDPPCFFTRNRQVDRFEWPFFPASKKKKKTSPRNSGDLPRYISVKISRFHTYFFFAKRKTFHLAAAARDSRRFKRRSNRGIWPSLSGVARPAGPRPLHSLTWLT